jgi:hypothetical protein
MRDKSSLKSLQKVRKLMSNKGKKSILIDADVYEIAKALAIIDKRTLKAFIEKMIIEKEKRANRV